MLILTKAGIGPGVDHAELTAMRAQFERDHVVRLPAFFGAELLLVGLSVNLSEQPFEGGVLEIREEGSQRIVTRVANPAPGDAVLFRISPDLEHHVTPVTTAAPRLVLAGWFRRSPNFWTKALRLAGARSGQA